MEANTQKPLVASVLEGKGNPKTLVNKRVQPLEKYLGLTLAEFLITIGILGIIFVIMFNSLFAYFKNQKIASQLGKFYHDLNYAIYFVESEQGIDLQTAGGNCGGVMEILKPYMKISNTKAIDGRNCLFEMPDGALIHLDYAGGLTFDYYLKSSYYYRRKRKAYFPFFKNKGSKKISAYCWGNCSTVKQKTRELQLQKCKETQDRDVCLYLLEMDKFKFKNDNPWKLGRYTGI